MEIVLSRRNLQTLLNKLDAVARGEESKCTLIKPDGTVVRAIENSEAYADREPGAVLPRDDPDR